MTFSPFKTSFIRNHAPWFALFLFFAIVAVPAQAQPRPQAGPETSVDDAVRQAWASGSSIPVIVRFASNADRDRATGQLATRGANARSVRSSRPSLKLRATEADIRGLAGARVSYDAPVRVSAVASSAPDTQNPAGAVQTSGPSANRSTVAVIDSGYQPHADIDAGRILAYEDFVGGSTSPVDGCGHGTHVAGIIAGSGAASDGAHAGLAPSSNLVVLRVLGNDCSGQTSDVIEALEWVFANRAIYGINVVNLSLGHPVFEPAATDPMVEAVNRLTAAGIAVVTAAGNMGINRDTGEPGYGGVGVPCNAPSSICVGAVDTKHTPSVEDDTVARYSSRGPSRFDLFAKPDLVATGHAVTSLSAPGSYLFEHYPGLQVSGGHEAGGAAQYMTLSGTSMAAPHVAAAAARVFAANKKLSANAVKMILQFTARIMPGVDALTQGAGDLNPDGANTLAAVIKTATPVGNYWLNGNLSAGIIADFASQSESWGKRILWGDRFLQGNSAYMHMASWDDVIIWGTDDNIVWGNSADDNIVWGNSADDNIVWGNSADDNIVWGNSVVWGTDNIVWGFWAANIVSGFWDDNIVWGNVTRMSEDNIVWGNNDDNIVWGNNDDNIVWGNDDNIVWGNSLVWGFTTLQVLTGGVR